MEKLKEVLVAGIMFLSVAIFSFMGCSSSSDSSSSTPLSEFSFATLHDNQGFIVQALKKEGVVILQLTEDVEAEHDAVIVDGDSLFPYEILSNETIKAYLENEKGVLILNATKEHKLALKDHIGFAYGSHKSQGYLVLPKADTLGREFVIIDHPRAAELARSNFSAMTPDSDDAPIEFDEEQFLSNQEEFRREINESTGPRVFVQSIITRLKENREGLTDSSVGDVAPSPYLKYRSWMIDNGRELYIRLNTAWLMWYLNNHTGQIDSKWWYPAGEWMTGFQQITHGHTTVITVYLDNDAENVSGNFQWLTVDHQGWWDTVDGDNHSIYEKDKSEELPLSPDAVDGKNKEYKLRPYNGYDSRKFIGWGWVVMAYEFSFAAPDKGQDFFYGNGLPVDEITETSKTENKSFSVSFSNGGVTGTFGVSKSITTTVPSWEVKVLSTPAQKKFDWSWHSNDPDWDENKINGFKDNNLSYEEYEPACYGVLQTDGVLNKTVDFAVDTGVHRLTTAAKGGADHVRYNLDKTLPLNCWIDFGSVLYPLVERVTIYPSSVMGGESASGTVTLDQNAPAGGTLVTLYSNNTGWAKVPDTVMVPEGQGAEVFPIATCPVDNDPTVTITAETHKVRVDADLTITAQ